VADRDTKAPLSHELSIAAEIKKQGMAQGLACYPNSGTIDGLNGDHVLLAPPYIIDQTHVEEIVDKLGLAVDAALNSKGILI
jgi:adenosylmethionine-8-amino-7-oxononanoate aminotransferase